MRNYVFKPLKLFAILIAAYSILLILVFLPYSDMLSEHIGSAAAILEEEGIYRQPVYAYAGKMQLDNFTDQLMIQKASGNSDLSPLQNAFSGYARYWHGYLVFLRPLLMVYSYGSIRYLSVFHLTLLMFGVAIMLSKKLGVRYAILFGIVLSMCNYIIFPYSLQFSSVFYVMLYAMLFILLFNKRRNDHAWLACIFLTIGSITNFVDLLTAPLLTLGIPLTLCYLLRSKQPQRGINEVANQRKRPVRRDGKPCVKDSDHFSFKSNLRYLLIGSSYWMAGYALTWVSKWALSYLIDSKEIVESVAYATKFRIFGGDLPNGNAYELNRFRTLDANLSDMYPRALVVLGILALVIFLIIVLKHHKAASAIWSNSPILCLCLYPYLWYMVLANHSHMHSFFTYRVQAIAVFALGAFLLNCIPDDFKLSRLCPGWIIRFRKKHPEGRERTE